MDLNVMMREQAKAGLQTQLDAAVQDGDQAKARELSDKLAQLAVATAPKPSTSYGSEEIKAELDKLDWFGVDAKKSARAMELGKHMDPKKFATAAAFAEALVKSVEEELKPAPAATTEGDDEEEPGDDDEEPAAKKETPNPRRTDGPGEGDTGSASTRRAASGPWVKLTDAPNDIRKEITRQADKFVPASATKEQREGFIKNALASHYNAHQQRAGKK